MDTVQLNKGFRKIKNIWYHQYIWVLQTHLLEERESRLIDFNGLLTYQGLFYA